MTSQTTTIKNGAITLPKEIRKAWQGADVYISSSQDSMFIKKLTPPSISFSDMAKEMQKAAREAGITKKDPADNHFLLCALLARADFIISGDSHLLELKKFRDVPILRPQEFIKHFNKLNKKSI